jgi:putative aldouronate transport system substrate-binding protein
MPIGLPKDLSKYWTLHYPPFGMNDRLFAITTNCKEPERAMEYLAYRHSYEGAMLCYNGVEGKDWVVENGKPKLTEWHLDIYLNDPDWMAVTGAHKYFNHTLRGGGHLHPDYGTPLDLHYAPEVDARLLRSKLHQDYCNHYGVAYPGGAIEHLQHFAQDSTIPSLLPVPTQEIKRLDDRIMTFLKTNLLKLVYTNSDEEFETMRAELKELGVEESIAYWSKAYANAKKELEELRSF